MDRFEVEIGGRTYEVEGETPQAAVAAAKKFHLQSTTEEQVTKTSNLADLRSRGDQYLEQAIEKGQAEGGGAAAKVALPILALSSAPLRVGAAGFGAYEGYKRGGIPLALAGAAAGAIRPGLTSAGLGTAAGYEKYGLPGAAIGAALGSVGAAPALAKVVPALKRVPYFSSEALGLEELSPVAANMEKTLIESGLAPEMAKKAAQNTVARAAAEAAPAATKAAAVTPPQFDPADLQIIAKLRQLAQASGKNKIEVVQAAQKVFPKSWQQVMEYVMAPRTRMGTINPPGPGWTPPPTPSLE